ncbi:MAG: hypothetical protein RIT04_136 [Candidatus Parcubacteria bacterium]|jgi:4-hydroxybenzoate polyprenyltransferase
MKQLLEKIEKTEVSIISWCVAFIGILFIRYILESLSSGNSSGAIIPDMLTFIHYTLFYAVITLGMLTILSVFLPAQRAILNKLRIYAFMIILIPPIIDLIVTGTDSGLMHYLFDTAHSVQYNFLTFFGPDLHNGITLGMRIEIGVALIAVAGYIYHRTRSILRAALCFIASYTFLFAIAILPTIITSIGTGENLLTSQMNPSDINFYFFSGVGNSILNHAFISPVYTFTSLNTYLQIHFSAVMAQIYFILMWLIAAIILYFTYPKFWQAVRLNLRPKRLVIYLGFIALGIALSIHMKGPILWNWADILSLITLLLAGTAARLSAVFFNDSVDNEIDTVNHNNRPIPLGLITTSEAKHIAVLFVALACIGGALLGGTVCFFIATFCVLGYIYSMPPLQLKQIPLVSSAVIALAMLAFTWSGFFFTHAGEKLSDFPLSYALALLALVTIFSNIRDIRDLAGDAAAGRLTLPTILGERRARQTIGTASGLAIALIPLYLSSIVSGVFASIIFPIIGLQIAWIIIMKKNPEPWVLMLILVAVICVVAV